MQHVLVDSTTLASAGHDPSSAVLELQFRSGAVYQYFSVPHAVYQSLLCALSKGVYFHQNIRGRYPYQRIHDALAATRSSRPLPA
jgi:hypothetical protein